MKKLFIGLMAAALVLVQPCAAKAGGTGTTINLSGQVKTGEDIEATVNEALRTARDNATAENPYTIIIPKGSYKLSSQLRIYSNTTLQATGATITYSNSGKASHNMLMSGDSSYNSTSECKGYEGFENISIVGGIWASTSYNQSSIMRIAHATNVKISGVTFSGGGCAHQMEVCAIMGFDVTGTTFKNLAAKKLEDVSDKQEALQLDIPCADAVYTGVYQDGTPMQNVTITGCTFDNVPRGLGTHTMLQGTYHSNIVITNNTFKNIAEEAIVGLNYKDCTISDNTITNCGAGVLFQYFKANTRSVYTTAESIAYKGTKNIIHDANTKIVHNTIITKYNPACDEIQGIKVYGVNLTKKSKGADGKYISAGDYYISGVTVENNTITTAGHGIHLSDAKKCIVKNNKITGAGVSAKDKLKKSYDGIFLSAASTDNLIYDNTISGMVRFGIFLMEGSSASNIEKNTISKSGSDGIRIYSKSKVTGDITGNQITSAGNNGIFLSTGSTAKNIVSNKISKSAATAIGVWNKCKVTGKIASNTLTDTKKTKFGICIQKSSTVNGAIEKNRILKSKSSKNSCGKGILICDKSVVKGKLFKNTIQNTTENAISVTNGATVGTIQANSITKAGNSAILINKSNVKGKICSNTITDTNVKGNVIHITAKSTVTSDIEKNVIGKKKNKYSGLSGILVYNSSTVKGKIISNKVTAVKSVGIYVNMNSTVKSIKNNKITGVGNQGINLASTKNNIVISGNTIKGGKENGILLQTNTNQYKVTVEKNTIYVKPDRYAVRAINGKVFVNKNTVSNKSLRIRLDSGVKGSVGKNIYK